MKILLLNGHGISMRVDGAKLHVRDGRFSAEEDPAEYVFSPQKIDVDSIIIYGKSGNLTLDAIRWLIKHKVQVTILNWDGKLLTTMLPPESVQVKTKFSQYRAFEDQKTRLMIAQQLIDAKIEKSQLVLDYLHLRYPHISPDLSQEAAKLDNANTIKEIMGVEGAVAQIYWREFMKAVPPEYEFEGRIVGKTNRPMGAADKVNCMLNYGYALLEAECLRAINATGLDVHVGYLHEMQIGKNSLAYDLQEPFRFLVDLAIISLLERGEMVKQDFIRTENFNLRMRPSGARKVTVAVDRWFNQTVEYQGKQSTWRYVLLLKTRVLAHYLVKKKRSLDLSTPEYDLARQDSAEMRQKILSISYDEWEKMGFSKGTLHYLKQNAMSDKPFTMNRHVRERLEKWKL